jgi:hypothetical protein
MTNKIKVITAPDRVLDRAKSILVICPSEDLKKSVQEYITTLDESINVYLYTDADKDIGWLLTTVNLADTIIVDIDNCTADINHFISYILSFSNTYYRCTNMIAQWNLINLNRFYDFPKF